MATKSEIKKQLESASKSLEESYTKTKSALLMAWNFVNEDIPKPMSKPKPATKKAGKSATNGNKKTNSSSKSATKK